MRDSNRYGYQLNRITKYQISSLLNQTKPDETPEFVIIYMKVALVFAICDRMPMKGILTVHCKIIQI